MKETTHETDLGRDGDGSELTQEPARPGEVRPGRYPDLHSRSAELANRARKVLPGGNTRTTVFRSPYPVYAVRGSGSRVTDADGVERVDFVNNYTALIHGHAQPQVVAAAERAIASGSSFGLPTEAEIRLAELICSRLESADQVRFTNSGTEAVMTALKAARAFTGRSMIAKCEGLYHGSYDPVEISLDSSPENWGEPSHPTGVPYSAGTPAGVMADVLVLPFNEPGVAQALLDQHAHEIAAVLVDPLPNRIGLIRATDGFLEVLRSFCDRAGALLISDEVISFRVGYQGAQTEFDFRADLTTLGKIIGGGFPVGAVAGRADVMAVFDPSHGKPRVPHGGTFNGNHVTMAAGTAAMELLTPESMERLNEVGRRAREAVQAALHEAAVPWRVNGEASLFRILPTVAEPVGYRSTWESPTARRQLSEFTGALLNYGVILDPGGLGCVSTATTDADLDVLADGVAMALAEAGIS